jgi:hypothetical protein
MKRLEERLNSFPFDMKAVKKRFGKKIEYLGQLVHPHVNATVHVFYQPQPNRELKHTEFFGLVYFFGNLFVMRLQGEELEAYAPQTAIKCYKCEDEIISLFRHDYQVCTCGTCIIDGGANYLRYNLAETALLFKVNTLSKERL